MTPEPVPLTEKQQRLLDFIVEHRTVHGFSPTTREMADAMGGISTTAVYDRLSALHRKGHIQRPNRSHRGIVPITGETP